MDCQKVDELLADSSLSNLVPEQRKEVEAHLTACRRCRGKWDGAYESTTLYQAARPRRDPDAIQGAVMARIAEGSGQPGAGPPQGHPAVPERIGGFEVLGVLGRGGMGTVLKARQVSMDRVVALKVLPMRLAEDEEFVARFVREAHAAARLRHPHIVQAYDAGLADGYYYFAMEFVDGRGLDAVLAHEGPLAQGRALRLMEQACGALAAAHEAGIVHRDIKPSNLLLDPQGEVRVTDFGLAKRLEGGSAAAIGASLGTPAYAAPEVCAGRKIDGRADLYSLGATFFHLLAGRPPFEDADIERLVAKQVTEQPPALAEVAPHLDPRLCRLIDRLLRKGPAERHPSAQALLEDLAGLGELRSGDAGLQDAPTVPLRPGQKLLRAFEAEQRRGGRRFSRRRLAGIAAGVAVACAVVGLTVVLWPRSPRQKGEVTFTTSVGPEHSTKDPREHNAEVVFRRAQRAAGLGQWVTAWRDLDLLRQQYESTAFYVAHHVEIAALRSQAERALQPAPPPAPPVAVGPPPEPPVPVVLPPEPELEAGKWVSLFDGEDLGGWRAIEAFPGAAGKFGDGTGGRAAVEDGAIRIEEGKPASGIAWTRPFPTADYELSLEAMRVAGDQDFATLTFPLGGQCATLLIGARHGPYTGLSMVDGRYYYPSNITTRKLPFVPKRWYQIRLRVTRERVAAWVDDEQLFDLDRRAHKIGAEIAWQAPARPFGITTWKTTAALRQLRVRRLLREPPEPPVEPGEWVALFDGRTLAGWEVAGEGRFADHGKVHVTDGSVVLEPGAPGTGIVWRRRFPTTDYEVAFEMRRDQGTNHAHVLFPVGPSHCILNLGGWDGNIVGLSLVDGERAPGNVTAKRVELLPGRWYRVRLRVTEAKVEAWLDDAQLIDLARAGHTLAPVNWPPDALAFCLSNWESRSAFRDIRYRHLGPEPPKLPDKPGEWASLFDGKTLSGWRLARGGDPAAPRAATVEGGRIVLAAGAPQTAIVWTGDFPTVDYELALEARREGGADSFCALFFPIGDSMCTMSVGGWGGRWVGLSRLDGRMAPESDAGREMGFETGRWYQVRLRVTEAKVEAWIDDEQVLDLARAGRRFTSRFSHVATTLALANWKTASGIRSIRMQRLEGKPEPPPANGTPLEEATVAVSALDGWTDTGLYLEQGKEYRLSATGRWGARQEWSHGPEGRARAAHGEYPLPGAVASDLIGRVGTQGRPFHVRREVTVRPARSGRLYLRMNDYMLGDNWGSVEARIAGPMVADKDAPLLSRFTRQLARVEVGPKSAWVASGVELRRGQRVLLIAEGTWDAGPLVGLVDAGGTDSKWRNQHRSGALLARVGPHGDLVTVGSRYLLEARDAGMLYLTINEVERRVGPALPAGGRVLLPGAFRVDDWVRRGGAVAQDDRALPPVPAQPGAEPLEAPRPPRVGPAAPAPIAPEALGERHVGPAAEDVPPPGNAGGRPGTLTITVFGPADAEPHPDEPKGPIGPDPGLVATLEGHAGWVISVAFSPDGARLASGGRDATVRLWDAATGKCLRTHAGHRGTVECVAFTPDGDRIISAGRDATLRVWDAASGQVARVLAGHKGAVRSVVALPDGTRAASTSDDGTLRIWDLLTGRCLRTLPCRAPCWGLAVSPDGSEVATAGDGGWVQIWDADAGLLEKSFFGQASALWTIAYSPDGTLLASAGDADAVRVWDTATWRRVGLVDVYGMMRAIAFSPDGRYLAAGGWYRVVRFWDATTWAPVRILKEQREEVRDLAFSRDGKQFATASFDGTINLWALEREGAVRRLAPEPRPLEPAAGDAPAPRPPAAVAAVERTWGKTANGLRCSLDPHPAEMRVGHAYVFDVAIENVSDKATHLHFPTGYQAQQLTIRTQAGDAIRRRPLAVYMPPDPKTFFHLIKPGERFTAQIKGRIACKWVRAADVPADPADRELLLDCGDTAHEIGRPGSFTAHVHLVVGDKEVALGKRYGFEPVWTGTLDSNPVAFSVRRMTAEELDARLRAVTEGTPREQLEAAEVLKASAARKAVPVLMGVLEKGPGPRHRAAADALGRIQDVSAAPGLLALYERFADRGDPVHGEFARCLLDAWSTLEPDEGKQADLFVKILGSAAAVEVRSSVAWRLVHMKHPQRIPALLAAARENNPRMQWAAIDALGSVAREGDDEARAPIAAALIELLKKAPERTVRSRAAGALRHVAHEATVPALVAALKDPNHFVGAAASHSLGELAGPEAIPALEAFAKAAEQKSQADAAKRAIERIKQRHP